MRRNTFNLKALSQHNYRIMLEYLEDLFVVGEGQGRNVIGGPFQGSISGVLILSDRGARIERFLWSSVDVEVCWGSRDDRFDRNWTLKNRPNEVEWFSEWIATIQSRLITGRKELRGISLEAASHPIEIKATRFFWSLAGLAHMRHVSAEAQKAAVSFTRSQSVKKVSDDLKETSALKSHIRSAHRRFQLRICEAILKRLVQILDHSMIVLIIYHDTESQLTCYCPLTATKGIDISAKALWPKASRPWTEYFESSMNEALFFCPLGAVSNNRKILFVSHTARFR